MAQLNNLLVTGSSRLLGKVYCEDLAINKSLTVSTLSVKGNTETEGTLNVGKNTPNNALIYLNSKMAIKGNDSWLRINDTKTFTSGIYFGNGVVRTDGIFQLGDSGNKVLFNTSSAKFTIPVNILNNLSVTGSISSNSLTTSTLAANNATVTNATVNDTLKAYKYELSTIQDLGGEFCVAPTIFIQSGATVNVSKASTTTITVSIKDTKAITSNTIQGIRWSASSKIKFQGKLDGVAIRCSGVMASKLNTDANTMALTLTVDSSIADHFATAVNGASYSDISVMLYQRYGKKIDSTDNVYSPVGIRMSAYGSTNAAPYLDIWGSKSSSDPDTVYTIPSVRLGYLGDISMTLNGSSISCNGYGLYADNVYLNGTIVSNSGSLGGFKIGTNDLSNGTWGTDQSVLMSTGTTESKIIGGSSAISGWCFTAGSNFGVTKTGTLYANDVNISGSVTATKGSVGGFIIGDNKLYTTGHETWNSDSDGIYIDSQYIALGTNGDGTPATYLTKNGTGKIGGWTVYKTYLKYGDLGTNNSSLLCPAGTVGEHTVAGHTSTGWTLTSGSNFGVTNDGGMYCSKGNIGGWDIATNGFCKNLTSFDAGDPGTYLGIDGLRNNDIHYGISMNAGLLKLWKKGNFAGAIYPVGGYGDSAGEKSSLHFCITEQHQSLSFGLATASTTTLGNVKDYDSCYIINRTGDYKNLFYNGVNINDGVNINGGLSVDSLSSEGNVKILGNYYRNDNLIGETIRGSGNQKTIANATWTNTGAYVKLPAGVYVLVGTNAFAASKGGRLAARFADSTQGYDVTAQVVSGMPSSMTAWVGCQWIVSITETTVYHLQAFQQTGSNLAVTGDIKAVRIA